MNGALGWSGRAIGNATHAASLPVSVQIIHPAPLSLWNQVAACDEFLDAELERAGFAAGELEDLAEGEGFVLGEKGDDFPRERRNKGSEAPFG